MLRKRHQFLHVSPLATRLVGLVSFILTTVIAAPSRADTATYPATAQLPPILVESDQFEVNLANQKAVWRGNVHAIQGNYTFRASSLTVHLDQITSNSSDGQSPSSQGSATQPGYELSAEVMSYDLENAQIVGRGNSQLRRGLEMIKADQITYSVEKRLAVAKPAENGRVFVQFVSNPEQPIFPLATPLAASAGE